MSKRKLLWDVLSEGQKNRCLEAIINYARNELGTDIGMIAANELFDAVMESAFAPVYNHALEDAQRVFQQKMDDLQVDLDMLKKR